MLHVRDVHGVASGERLRYSKGLATTQKLPELQAETYEFDMAVEAISSTVSGEKGGNEVEEVLDENDWLRERLEMTRELRPGTDVRS